MRTRIKICGITRIEDAHCAVEAGADAIGLVFHPASPRALSLDAVADLIAQLPPFVSTVGLLVNADRGLLHEVVTLGLHLLQFHGDESPAECEQAGVPYIKAVRMAPLFDLEREVARYPGAAAILVDSYDPQRYGGTGQTFDWGRLPSVLSKPLILAGGLTPDNVAAAIRQVGPYAVDVSGGVERAKGVKDHGKIRAFVKAVARGDAVRGGAVEP
ncbi:MAG: phosphoribosylanthranilate isomerase [Pseudomonadales bacterium]|jgi:phosphoribosylanthranilate isomerase|nr:phosphoribosylanthranilate isomerase [Pseudomonadales bacterium]MCC6529885.1 phosphoribosylanthranilate isomerase [Pseudomonadales bacterium]HMU90519.1 phosphoribosylanthranilate isomerase [Pseudomonadales bacterium]HMW15321.1 phosphoribosylanthranilate isomerase [Pseudomonadales bacterium]HMW83556.1 phosphoribosylanthranilate isomerase [Pseudomonadales bacterium]